MRNGDKTRHEISYFDEQTQNYIEVNIDKARDKFMETDNILKEEKKLISFYCPLYFERLNKEIR